MRVNTDIEIEIGVHSDQRESEKYGLSLTSIKAKGIKEELIHHGIEAERITNKGYSSTKPVISEEKINRMKIGKEAAYRKNRRLEIKITKT